MTGQNPDSNASGGSRREFLRTSSLLGAALATGAAGSGAYAAGSDTIKVGLIGCGGRGTGAAVNAMAAGKDVKLVAMGDMFRENLESSRSQLRSEGADRFAVTDEKCFVGFDAYKQVIDSGVDLVILATPPGFRPVHLRYAVDKGKHSFVEKPVAVDGPGIRAVLAACEDAKKKGLAVGSGLCWRYHPAMRDTVKRVQDGAIGQIVNLQCTYNVHNAKEPIAYDPSKWSEMEWQIRNWYYFSWLSGDFNVEQHVHSLDKMAWVMKDVYPAKATGIGGRQVRTGLECGNIYDHHVVLYEFPDGTRCFSECRQQNGTATEVTDYIYGTKGVATLLGPGSNRNWTIRPYDKAEKPWRFPRNGNAINMYQQEHDELFASIRAGKPINDGEWMSKSSLMGIMGRMATYTGQPVTWEQALNSKEDLAPKQYAFGPNPVHPPAIPGITKIA
ncbi:MAG: Gfo/Idh/MocA family oxidoreductase [Isosphaeraceae bacterium]